MRMKIVKIKIMKIIVMYINVFDNDSKNVEDDSKSDSIENESDGNN